VLPLPDRFGIDILAIVITEAMMIIDSAIPLALLPFF
jgi:hypothetical protein